jgi:citrate lyase gamma subunit
MRIIFLGLFIALFTSAFGQFGIPSSIRKSAEKHAKKKGEEIGREQAKKGEEAGMRAASDGIDKLVKWEDEQFGPVEIFIDENLIEESDVQWQKLQFVTGSDLIFYDKPFNFEEKRKQPTNWILSNDKKGSIEIGELDQGMSIVAAGPGSLTPKIDKAKEDYLPGSFTVEFDFLMTITPFGKPINLNFYAINEQSSEGFSPIIINQSMVIYKDSSAKYPVMANQDNGMPNWYRVSVSFDNGLINIYLNERKMITYKDDINPTGISIDFVAITPISFSNFIIAKNPKTVFEQLKEGDFTSYNIDYLMNYEKLNGVSISELSKIAVILIKNPDLKMEVDVYFSQSSKNKENKEFSKLKTETIKNTLIAMGVEESQLTVNNKGSIITSAINPKNRLSDAVVFRLK